MSFIFKNMDIKIETTCNLADFIIEAPKKILEEIADEFKLDKSTIEPVFLIDKDTEYFHHQYQTHHSAYIMKYKDYWLGIKFNILTTCPSTDSGTKKLADVSNFEGQYFGNLGPYRISKTTYYKGVYHANQTYANLDIDHPSAGASHVYSNAYQGIGISLVFLDNKDMDFYSGNASLNYQTLSYNSLVYSITEQKYYFSFGLTYLYDKDTNELIFFDTYHFHQAAVGFQTGFIKIDTSNDLYLLDLNLTIKSKNGTYSLHPSSATINGSFLDFAKNYNYYSIALPCYLCSGDRTIAYLNKIASKMYRCKGAYVLGQDYVVDGTMYYCLAVDGQNALLINKGISYDEWKREEDK